MYWNKKKKICYYRKCDYTVVVKRVVFLIVKWMFFKYIFRRWKVIGVFFSRFTKSTIIYSVEEALSQNKVHSEQSVCSPNSLEQKHANSNWMLLTVAAIMQVEYMFS